MQQNLDVILWQFNYGKKSFIVLIPEDQPYSDPSPNGEVLSMYGRQDDVI